MDMKPIAVQRALQRAAQARRAKLIEQARQEAERIRQQERMAYWWALP